MTMPFNQSAVRRMNVEQLIERKTLDNLVYIWYRVRPERASQIEKELTEKVDRYQRKYGETYFYSLARDNGRGK